MFKLMTPTVTDEVKIRDYLRRNIFILTALKNWLYYPHFTDEKNEALRAQHLPKTANLVDIKPGIRIFSPEKKKKKRKKKEFPVWHNSISNVSAVPGCRFDAQTGAVG